MAEFSAVEKHYMDRAFQSNFALWSALLTINGIMISAFSLLRLIVPNVNAIVVVLLVGSCAISMLLIVSNFLITKQHYQETGRRVMSQDTDISDKQMEIQITIRKHRNTERRERAVLILLIVEVCLVILLLVLAG